MTVRKVTVKVRHLGFFLSFFYNCVAGYFEGKASWVSDLSSLFSVRVRQVTL